MLLRLVFDKFLVFEAAMVHYTYRKTSKTKKEIKKRDEVMHVSRPAFPLSSNVNKLHYVGMKMNAIVHDPHDERAKVKQIEDPQDYVCSTTILF